MVREVGPRKVCAAVGRTEPPSPPPLSLSSLSPSLSLLSLSLSLSERRPLRQQLDQLLL